VCVEDGTVVATWEDTTTTEFTFKAGDSFRFFAVDCTRVQVTSGTFLNIYLG
jgi:hypothetical protein